jgi:hypothetical protein
MRKALLGVALALWLAPAGHAAAPGQRLLFVSNRTGPTQIYAADPAGKAPFGQLTFAPAQTCDSPSACGGQHPLPSPDGSRVLFTTEYTVYPDSSRATKAYALWITRANGSGLRRVSPVDEETHKIGSVVWAPNSKRFAYVVGGEPSTVHVAGADGGGDHVLRRFAGPAIRWSSDSRRILSGDRASGHSPNGRWRTVWGYPHDSLTVTRKDPPKTWSVPEHTWGAPAWSPNSRLLAYPIFPRGVGLLDVRTGRTRKLSPDAALELAWAPDGRSLAYRAVPTLDGRVLQPLDTSGAGTDLRTVTLGGRVRTVVAADGPFGGAVAFAWARAPKFRYRAPEAVDGYYARSLVKDLAADGSRLAYATCSEGRVISTPTGASATFGDLLCIGSGPSVGTLAVSDSRVAYTTIAGGLTTSWSIAGLAVEPVIQPFRIELGHEACCEARPAVAADGDFLAYATHRRLDSSTSEWQVREIGPTGCDCRLVTRLTQSSRDPLALGIEAGRVLLKGRDWVQVFDRKGELLVLIDGIPGEPPVYALDPTADATSSGNLVVVRFGQTFRTYDLNTRAWGATRPAIGRDPAIDDAARGLIAYETQGRREIHVLRLADGTDTVVAHGTLARFMDDGMAYADGARIRVASWASLP